MAVCGRARGTPPCSDCRGTVWSCRSAPVSGTVTRSKPLAATEVTRAAMPVCPSGVMAWTLSCGPCGQHGIGATAPVHVAAEYPDLVAAVSAEHDALAVGRPDGIVTAALEGDATERRIARDRAARRRARCRRCRGGSRGHRARRADCGRCAVREQRLDATVRDRRERGWRAAPGRRRERGHRATAPPWDEYRAWSGPGR